MQVFYKIRHKVTGKYSKGGVIGAGNEGHYGWSERGGKTWDTLSKLRAHLTMNDSTNMENWEILEYQIPEPVVKTAYDVMDPKKVWRRLQE